MLMDENFHYDVIPDAAGCKNFLARFDAPDSCICYCERSKFSHANASFPENISYRIPKEKDVYL